MYFNVFFLLLILDFVIVIVDLKDVRILNEHLRS